MRKNSRAAMLSEYGKAIEPIGWSDFCIYSEAKCERIIFLGLCITYKSPTKSRRVMLLPRSIARASQMSCISNNAIFKMHLSSVAPLAGWFASSLDESQRARISCTYTKGGTTVLIDFV